MPVPDKDVRITASNMTITVDILFPGTPGYDPLQAQVTIQRLSNGQTIDLTGMGTLIAEGARYEHTDQLAGPYDVEVVCSDKSFGEMVSLPAATITKAFFHLHVE